MKILISCIIIVLFSGVVTAQTEVLKDTVPSPSEIAPTKEMLENATYDLVDEVASFPGGTKEMMKFLWTNIHYPKYESEIAISGKVIIKFTVMKDGSITDVKVIKGFVDCPECDAEAVRVVKMMPRWIPAKKNGEDVNSYYILPITFSIQ